MNLLVLFSLACFVLVCAKPSPRVVGGKNANSHEFPYQISLRVKSHHICGGSILSPYYVITAAHCVIAALEDTTVVAGAHNLEKLNGEEQVREVVAVETHEKYGGGVGPYDIALYKLNKPFDLNKYVKIIDLPEEGSYPQGDAVLSGWGSTSRTAVPSYPNILQVCITCMLSL